MLPHLSSKDRIQYQDNVITFEDQDVYLLPFTESDHLFSICLLFSIVYPRKQIALVMLIEESRWVPLRR